MRSVAATMVAFATAPVVACGTSPPSADAGTTTDATWMVDCVAVLGGPRPSSQSPLDAVPRSGVPREKQIAALSDEDLGRLCDFDACITSNGYRRTCDGSGPQLQPEVVSTLSSAVVSCYPTPAGAVQDGWDSREDCMSIYRAYFASCHVSSWEDCLREWAWAPLAAFTWGPDCATTVAECPVP
jgi:hypothetical protein